MIATAGSRLVAGEPVYLAHGKVWSFTTRNYHLISKEQRHMEQMDKLRRTLAKSERKRREKALYR